MTTAIFKLEMPPLTEISVEQQWTKRKSTRDSANGCLKSGSFDILPSLN